MKITDRCLVKRKRKRNHSKNERKKDLEIPDEKGTFSRFERRARKRPRPQVGRRYAHVGTTNDYPRSRGHARM